MQICVNCKHCFYCKEYVKSDPLSSYYLHKIRYYKIKYYCAVRDKLDPVTGKRDRGQECIYRRYKNSQIILECPDYEEKCTLKLLFKRFLNIFKKKWILNIS